MPAQNINLQPRRTPPKPQDRARQQELLELQATTAAVEAKEAEAKSNKPAEPETNFAELSDVFANPEAPKVDSKAKVVESNHSKVAKQPTSGKTPRPPRTKAEYLEEHRAPSGEYHDVVDIFTGKAGIKPETGYVKIEPPKPMPQQTHREQPQEVVIKHEIVDQRLAYEFTRDAQIYLGGVFRAFKAGELIYETTTIEQIIQGGFDGLIPVEVADKFIECPKCHHQFPEVLA